MLRQITYRAVLAVTGIVVAIVIVSTLTSWIKDRWRPSHLQRVKDSGALRILTLYGATTYYPTLDGFAGMEYELATRFAQWLGVRPVFHAVDSISELLPRIMKGEDDLAAAGLTVTDVRKIYLRFSTPYQMITEQVVYLGGNKRPRTVSDLTGHRLEVMAGSSHQRTLEILKQRYPELAWQALDVDIETLLQRVEAGRSDYAVSDSHQFATLRRFYPRLKAAFDLIKPAPLAWAFSKNHDGSLHREAQKFFHYLQENQILAQLREQYYGHVDALGYVDIYTFRRHYKERLPKYRRYFEQAARKHGWDWRLLAAIGYQESHWNNHAKSPTGVRGIMMLTRQTAKQLHIQNRLDAGHTIPGAARYLSQLKAKIPARIPEPDRTWLTLAAYNIGFGHLEDARVLTQSNGGNPDRWMDVKKHLPLLTRKKWYSRVKHGYARGYEPVRYVENVRNYYDLLVRLTEGPISRPKQRQVPVSSSGESAAHSKIPETTPAAL